MVFPCYDFARVLCSSMERGLKGRLNLRAVISCMARVEFFGNNVADRSYGGPVHLLE